jgi:hypothetical protein
MHFLKSNLSSITHPCLISPHRHSLGADYNSKLCGAENKNTQICPICQNFSQAKNKKLQIFAVPGEHIQNLILAGLEISTKPDTIRNTSGA